MEYRRVLTAFLFLCIFFIGSFDTVSAQDRGAGVKLIPATVEQAADPGEVIETELTITNLNDEEKEYFLFKRNIKGVGSGGTPIFAESDAEVTGYEITEWIAFEETSYVLGPGESMTIPVTINVPENASPGSHFGGIFASVEPPRIREIGAGVGYQVASIISIRISGEVVDSARIRSFYTDKLFYGEKDVDFTATIENQGNILIRPRGPLTITSMFSSEPVAVMTVNDSLAGVFPGTTRDLEFSWEDEGLGFGRYEAVLALVYDGDNGQRTIDASLVFWVFPSNVIVPALIILAVILLGGYFLTRMYINRAMMQASGRRRVAPQRYRKQVGVSRFMFVFISILLTLLLFFVILFMFFA